MSSYMRRKVSQNRKRYVDDDYDLDLTYITNNIIAMGYPSDSILQSLIRNRIGTVSKYLNEKHNESFKVFNLCIESDYDFHHFDNKVELYSIEDHNAPKFLQIDKFCKDVEKWLTEKDSNVAIVHCKAGKGRTGTMISCYFLYSNKFSSPFDAMKEFDVKRCIDQKGVTIPSQRRYIEYFSYYHKNNLKYEPKILGLKSIEIRLPNDSKTFPKSLRLEIKADFFNKIYEAKSSKIKETNNFLFDFPSPIQLKDDIRVLFLTRKSAKFLIVSFNTFCMSQLEQYKNLNDQSCLGKMEYDNQKNEIKWYLKKDQIDLAFKNKNIHPDLTLVFKFDISQNAALTSIPENINQVNLLSTEATVQSINEDSNRLVAKSNSNSKCYKSFKKIFS